MEFPVPSDAPYAPFCDTVQLNVVPEIVPERFVEAVVPEQTVCETGVEVTFGVGLTVTVKVIGFPVQPFAEAVTLTVAVTGLLVVFFAVNAEIPSALPLVPNPTSTVLLQL